MPEKKLWLMYLQVVTDFFDELKSRSSGYASFDYEDAGYRAGDLGNDLLINYIPTSSSTLFKEVKILIRLFRLRSCWLPTFLLYWRLFV